MENEAKIRVRAQMLFCREASRPYFHIFLSDLQDSIGEMDNLLNPAQKMEVYLQILPIKSFQKGTISAFVTKRASAKKDAISVQFQLLQKFLVPQLQLCSVYLHLRKIN